MTAEAASLLLNLQHTTESEIPELWDKAFYLKDNVGLPCAPGSMPSLQRFCATSPAWQKSHSG
jgi:hypothetical protein